MTRQSHSRIKLRSYQLPVFEDDKTGILVLHWSRQIGKSFTLAAWAVNRLLEYPGRLVTVLSNSRENGAEFLQKCLEVCELLDDVLRKKKAEVEAKDLSPDLALESMRFELRIKVTPDDKIERTGRIKVLAANPRTARGFSGDLILDEFAFHEDSAAIWEAAEPILSSNKDFLCRIASTGNGKHNMFYRMAHGTLLDPLSSNAVGGEGRGEEALKEQTKTHIADCCQTYSSHLSYSSHPSRNFGILESAAGFKLSRVPRTMAYQLGVPVYDPRTRKPITPEAARAHALDKRAYDQNYECVFADENLTLLTHELISAAEDETVGEICEQNWSAHQLSTLQQSAGPLYVGFDVARHGDLSVITVIEKIGGLNLVRAMLRIQDMRLPDQQLRLGEICRLPKFSRAAIDMTGLGLGLFEYAQKEFGAGRIHGINFATTVRVTDAILAEGRQRETVRVTEALALELLQTYEDRRIRQPIDARLRDDLRKPEKITTPGGRVSIAATRTEAGHADHFWSLALALEAAGKTGGPFAWQPIKLTNNVMSRGRVLI